MKMHHIHLTGWKTMLIASVVLAFSSCTQRDLEVMLDRGNLNLFFDWSGLAGTNTAPSSMKVLFYNATGDTASVSGGSETQLASLPFGTYKMLTYNTTAQGVGFRNLNNFSQAEAYALPLSTSVSKALSMAFAPKAEMYLAQPRDLYGVGGNTIELSLGDAQRDTLKPQTLIKQLSLEIQITGDVKSVSSCHLTLENIASGVSLSTGVPIYGKPGTIAFESIASTGGFTTTVNCFGQDTTVVAHDLSLVLGFTNGAEQTVVTDFTKALEQAEVTVIPVDVELKVDVTHTDAGFKATLKDWNIVDGTIVAGDVSKKQFNQKKEQYK